MSREVERRILRQLQGRKSRIEVPEIHGHIIRQHLYESNEILAQFVSVCGKVDKMRHAHVVFGQNPNPNILLFNSMIKAYSLCGPFEESVNLFSIMKKRGIWADQYTLAPLLKSCTNLSDLKLGQGVHAQLLGLGFQSYNPIRTGIVELYTACNRMEEATKVFDEMLLHRDRDVILWNLMIRGFCKIGDVQRGFTLFRQMKDRSIVSWNSIISCLAQSGRHTEALQLFCEMRDSGFKPDEATVVTMLPLCARLGQDDIGEWIHTHANSTGLLRDFVSVGNSLVHFYCKRGNLETAFIVFQEMPLKNVVSYNALISGLAFNGKGELGVRLFEEMTNKGVIPNDTTLIGALACCAHAGLVQRGRDLFASMISKYHMNPKLEHYGCMVDLLGRSGCLKEAHGLIHSMPMKPNAALWGALLSACHTHADLELAECAVKELINLEPKNSGNYVLLSNIYAERGKWDEVAKVRLLMTENSIKKAPGQSMIG